MILPDTEDTDTAGFWAAARGGKLVVQRCDACGQMRFPPHPYCAVCRALASSWVQVSGRGRLWSHVIVHNPTLPAFAEFVPFPVVVVELEEVPRLRMTGNVLDHATAAINSVDPRALTIGMPLRVAFKKVSEEVTLPLWLIEGQP
jgi:uncharacterized OB-fold protein